MKIAFFMDDFFPSINGVNMVIDNYAKRLKKTFEVVVIVPYVDKNFVDNFDYKVIRVKSIKLKKYGYSLSLPFFDKKLKKQLEEEHFDLVHIHSPFVMGRFAVKFARRNNIPVVATIHTRFEYEINRAVKSNIIRKFLFNYLMKTFNMCDKCFTLNQAILDLYIGFGLKTDVSFIPNATDMVKSDNPKVDANFINKEYSIDNDDKVFLFVGRITVVKNILLIVDALKIVKENNIKFKMIFIGPDEDKNILLKKIRENKLTDNIIVLDKITDRSLLSKFYVRADLFLFPSVFDTSSLVQVEAASQMVPGVFVFGAPTASNIKDNVNGFISKEDAQCYGRRILDIISNEKLYKKVSSKCYSDLYVSWDMVVKLLKSEYKKIVK